MTNKYRVAEFISTFFYIGKIRYCPGTFGSLAAYPLSYILNYFAATYLINSSLYTMNSTEGQIINKIILYLIVCFVLFIVGTYFSSKYVSFTKREDPKEVVIDEVVGQLLVVALCILPTELLYHSMHAEISNRWPTEIVFTFLLPFCLFRLFDILKPWPINWLDKNIKGGLGIMLDDILAAIFASIMYCVIIFFIIDWLG